MTRRMRLSMLMLATVAGRAVAQRPADHVVLVTIDGLRARDLFGGADSAVVANHRLSGIDDTAAFRTRYVRNTEAERRRAVMPFFWDSLVPQGFIVGAPGTASVRSTNGHKFSAPGYQEIYTGAPQADVTSNDNKGYPHRTIFDVVRDAAGTRRTDVAAFVSWDVQGRLVSNRPGAVVVNAANEPFPQESRVERVAILEQVESRIFHVDGRSMRHDAITHALALDYLTRYRPMLLHIGYGETDVEAHERRYDRLFDMMRATDDMLRELWTSIQRDPQLRNRTALLITTDHGRGATPANWSDHGNDVPGADSIWIAGIGAGIAARGDIRDLPATQSQVGPTALALLGLAPSQLGPGAAGAMKLK